jgi:flagellar biosynthetic protein FliR
MNATLSGLSALSDGVTLGSGWLVRTLLLSLRLGAMLLATPLLAISGIPVLVRVLFVVGLAAAMSAGPDIGSFAPLMLIDRPGALIQSALTELALGATLALGIHLAFAAFAVAGRVLDISIGYGIGQVFDPASNTQLPVLTTAYNQIALVVFVTVNGHHALMRGIAYSLERFPLAQPWPMEAAVMPVMKQVAGLFSLSFALAVPVLFCVLLVEFSLGVLARNLPQMNMLTMGIPIKIVVGLLTLSLWSLGVGPVMSRVYGSIQSAWDEIFVGAHPNQAGRR